MASITASDKYGRKVTFDWKSAGDPSEKDFDEIFSEAENQGVISALSEEDKAKVPNGTLDPLDKAIQANETPGAKQALKNKDARVPAVAPQGTELEPPAPPPQIQSPDAREAARLQPDAEWLDKVRHPFATGVIRGLENSMGAKKTKMPDESRVSMDIGQLAGGIAPILAGGEGALPAMISQAIMRNYQTDDPKRLAMDAVMSGAMAKLPAALGEKLYQRLLTGGSIGELSATVPPIVENMMKSGKINDGNLPDAHDQLLGVLTGSAFGLIPHMPADLHERMKAAGVPEFEANGVLKATHGKNGWTDLAPEADADPIRPLSEPGALEEAIARVNPDAPPVQKPQAAPKKAKESQRKPKAAEPENSGVTLAGHEAFQKMFKNGAIEIHPDDLEGLGLQLPVQAGGTRVSAPEMRSRMGVPVRVTENARTLQDVAERMNSEIRQERDDGSPPEYRLRNGQFLDVQPDLEAGFHPDDIQQALLNRPHTQKQRKAAIDEHLARLNPEDNRYDPNSMYEAEPAGEPGTVTGKGFLPDWEDLPFSRTSQRDLFGGDAAPKGASKTKLEQEDLFGGEGRRAGDGGPIGRGKEDAGLEGTPLQEGADAASHGDEQTTLFSRTAHTKTPEFKKWFGDSKVVDDKGEPLVVYHGTSGTDFDQFKSHTVQDVHHLDGKEISVANSWDYGEDAKGMPDGYHFGAVSDAHDLGPDEAFKFREAEAKKHPPTSPGAKRHIEDLRRMVGKKITRTKESRPNGAAFYFTPSENYSFIRDIGRREGGRVIPAYVKIENPIHLNAAEIERAGQDFMVAKYKKEGYDGAIYSPSKDDLRLGGINGQTQIVAFSPTQIKSIHNRGTFDANDPRILFSRRLGTVVKKAVDEFQAGKMPAGRMAELLDEKIKEVEAGRDAALEKRYSTDRVRGSEWIAEKLSRAARHGDIHPEVADLGKWFVEKNPHLVKTLGIGIRSAKKEWGEGAAGLYAPSDRVIFLIKGAGSGSGKAKWATAVHEILHHTERMMPEKIRAGIRREWAKHVVEALRNADAPTAKYLRNALEAAEGSPQALGDLRTQMESGKYPSKMYHLLNPSEFWAVKGSEILAGRHAASKAGWVAKAKQWLSEFIQKARSLVGASSDNAVLRGLKDVLNGNGDFIQKRLLNSEKGPLFSRMDKRLDELTGAETEGGQKPSDLDRDETRKESQVRAEGEKIAREWTDEQFINAAGERALNDAEKAGMDARATYLREEADRAWQHVVGAKTAADANAARGLWTIANLRRIAILKSQINDLSGAGRALAAARYVMKGVGRVDDDFMRSLFQTVRGKSLTDAQMTDLMEIYKKDPAAVPELLRRMTDKWSMKAIMELWKAGLLTGPSTDIVNFTGNTLERVMLNAETAIAPIFDKALGAFGKSDRTRFFGDAVAEAVGTYRAFPEAMREFGKGMKSLHKDEPLDLSTKFDFQLGATPGKLGVYPRVTFNRLVVADRFFKALGWKGGAGGSLFKLARRRAISELGGSGSRKQIAKKMQEVMDGVNAGEGKYRSLIRELRLEQERSTFQEDPGAIVNWLVEGERKIPLLGFVMPFKKTPGNILHRAIERSPLGNVKVYRKVQAYREALATKGTSKADLRKLRGEAADAAARMALGTGLFAGFYAMAAAGMITGGGPSDPQMKKTLMETGWLPHALKIGNKYYSLQRFDPLSTLIMTAADIADRKEVDADLVTQVLNSTISNVFDKSYLQGAIEFSNALSSPIGPGAGESWSNYAANMAGSIVPNIVARGAVAMDPVYRNMQTTEKGTAGLLEKSKLKLMSRTPLWSKKIEPTYTPTGAEARRPGGPVSRFLAPAPGSPPRDNAAVANELYRIGKAPPDISRKFPVPTDLLRADKNLGKSTMLTPEEFQLLVSARRKGIKTISEAMKDEKWKSADAFDLQNQVKEMLEDPMNGARERIRGMVRRRLLSGIRNKSIAAGLNGK